MPCVFKRGRSIELHPGGVLGILKTLLIKSLAEALKIEAFQLLLPIETFPAPAVSPNEALRKLNKAKRVFDDSFNAILNFVHVIIELIRS
jgi:hypothetical protein